MFASKFFRPARQATSHIRRYATEPSSGGSNTLLYGAAAAAVGGGGYYFYNRSSAPAKAQPAKAQGAPASKEEENTVPKQTGGDVKAVKCFTGGEQGFVSLLLESVEEINHNTKKFRFHLPEEDSVSGLSVASALISKYKGPEMEKPVIRPYTPISDEDAVGYLDFIVKRYPGGPMSEHMHEMVPGQRLDFKGPIPKYPWEANKHDHIGLITGGTGITPMYQLCRAIFKNPEDKTKVTIVYGSVSEEDVLMKRELEDLEQEFPNRFRAFYVLNNPPENWPGGKGMINKELLKTVLPGPEKENIKLFVCGPPGMYKAISGPKKSPKDQGDLAGYLAELGYAKDQVYKF